ncbi:MAG: hypothetical protein VB036_05800, partial [Propionicimonas sp.]|nr:hypothetical protein [Propionicimonas sp.]
VASSSAGALPFRAALPPGVAVLVARPGLAAPFAAGAAFPFRCRGTGVVMSSSVVDLAAALERADTGNLSKY